MTEMIEVINPRIGEILTRIPSGDAKSAAAAVEKADAAWHEWKSMPQAQRSALLRLCAEQLDAELDDLVTSETLETGQPEDSVRGAVAAGIENWRHFATEAENYLSQELPKGGRINRRPFGVAGLIVPWNYPLLIAFRFLPGLLSVGNTVVWKPSERTPVSAIRAMEVIERVLPEGVVSLLLGDGRAGGPLVEDERVKIVAFTGSTATGKKVSEISGRLLRPVLLELGGKDAVIVDTGVDVQWVAERVAEGCFTNTGQICTSMERVYVHQDILEELTQRLVSVTEANWKIMPDGGPVGPMIDAAQRDVVSSHVEDAREKGATVRTGGVAPDLPGTFFPPTVITGVRQDMQIMQAETFGPIAAIMGFNSKEEAIELASDSRYGLALTVFSPDQEMHALAEKVDVGIVYVNGWHSYAEGALHQPGRDSGTAAIGWQSSQFLDAVSAPTFFSPDPLAPKS